MEFEMQNSLAEAPRSNNTTSEMWEVEFHFEYLIEAAVQRRKRVCLFAKTY